MGSTGFGSPRSDGFPAGLRVLVVDNDSSSLDILEQMLNQCNYKVTTCGLVREALDMLQGKTDGFEIVICDVNMPDMDAFKILQHGLKMDLPMIMMSADGETSRVMKGVENGACAYLLKPIRMQELKIIWQHVYRRRKHEPRSIEEHAQSDDSFTGGSMIPRNKRKVVESKNSTDGELCGNPSSSIKKPRVVWASNLHDKFVEAVNLIGLDKAGPKKILDLMGVPNLTRENVASHLQKYRLYLSRQQKENELKPAACGGIGGGGGVNLSADVSSARTNICLQSAINLNSAATVMPQTRVQSAIISHQNSATMLQNIVINENSNSMARHKIQIQDHNANIYKVNSSRIISMPMAAAAAAEAEPKKSLFGDLTNLPINSPGYNNNSFKFLDSEVKSESNIQPRCTWCPVVPSHFQSEHRLIPVPMPVDLLSHTPAPLSFRQEHKPTLANIYPSSTYATGTENTSALLPKIYQPFALHDVESHGYYSSCDLYQQDPHPFVQTNQELIDDFRPELYDSEIFESSPSHQDEFLLQDQLIS